MTKLKVGVIGVGGIARTHMPGWAASENAEVVAGCDLNSEILNRWGSEHNIKKLHSDPTDLFNDSEIDIIDVSNINLALNKTCDSHRSGDNQTEKMPGRKR